MLSRNGRLVLGVVGTLAVLVFMTNGVLSAPPATPTTVPAARPHPPGELHYHFHTHYHASTHPLVPSAYQATALYPQTQARDAVINAYAPASGAWPYAPLPQINTDPRAATYGTIHVFLPVANAELYLNGQKTKGTGKDRVLKTPPLPINREYQYVLTSRFKQGKETETQYRKVFVGAGDYTVADFTKPQPAEPTRLPSGPVGTDTIDPD